MPFEERPPWMLTAASYAPLMVGGSMSGSRALSAMRDLGPPIRRTIASNQAANASVIAMQRDIAAVFQSRGSVDDVASVLDRLAASGIDQLEFTDTVKQHLDDSGQAGVNALYKLLGTPELGLGLEEISTQMSAIHQGEQVSEMASRIATTPRLRTIFFEKFAEEQGFEQAGKAFNPKSSMVGGVFGENILAKAPFISKARCPEALQESC